LPLASTPEGGQLLRMFCQPENPAGSGSRPKKSTYCWRTKKGTPTTGLPLVTASSSVIVMVAVEREPRPAPAGSLRAFSLHGAADLLTRAARLSPHRLGLHGPTSRPRASPCSRAWSRRSGSRPSGRPSTQSQGRARHLRQAQPHRPLHRAQPSLIPTLRGR